MPDTLSTTRHLAPLPLPAGFPSQGQDCHLSRAKDGQGTVYVIRRPRNKEKKALLQREVRLLQRNAGTFPFAVPAAEWLEDGMIYPELPGRPAITTTSRGEPLWQVNTQSLVFLRSWARVLVNIHTRADFFAPPFSPLFPTNRNTAPRQDFLNILHFVRRNKAAPESDLQRWQNWAESTRWPDMAVPVHGDMHAGNILTDDTGAVSGILDWTRAAWGDPALDFIFHYLGFGEQGLDLLLDAYSREGGRLYEGMKEHITGLWDAYPLRQAFFHCLENEVR